MTSYDILSISISILGLLAVVVSIWFLRSQVRIMADQTRRLTDTLEMSAETALDGLFVVVTQAYLDHPELRPIFNERESLGNVEIAGDDMRYRANALAETLLDAMERALNFSSQGVSPIIGSLRIWIEDSFRDSTFLREWLAAHRSWYPVLVPILDRVHAELIVKTPSQVGVESN